MKKIYVFMAMCCMIILSCSKQEIGLSTNALQTSNKSVTPNYLPGSCPFPCTDTRCKGYVNGYCGTDTIAVIKNTNNAYDNVGNQHNQGVRSILPTVNTSSNNLDSAVLVKVKSYISTIGYSATAMQTFYDQAVQQTYFPFSHLQRLDSLGNKMYANGVISSYSNSYAQQIYSYANQYLNTDTITNAKYTSFCNNLISLESTIKNDSRISAAEKQTLLSSCATGRYSASFWGNYFSSSNNSNAAAKSTIKPLLLQKLKRWVKVVLSDVAGGLVGISGGAVGIIGGAVGSSVLADISLN